MRFEVLKAVTEYCWVLGYDAVSCSVLSVLTYSLVLSLVYWHILLFCP
jgi:hypothetical protein